MTSATDLLAHALKNNGHRCFCNHPLTFNQIAGGTYQCHCERCERRSLFVDGVIDLTGYGSDPDLAFEDWLEAQRRM